jgi:acetyltransferase
LSGGEAALMADLGNELGIEYAELAPETLARLRPAFPSYSSIGNPLDAWGLGFNPERFRVVLSALLADPTIGTIGFSVDAPGQGGGDVPYACIMAEACVAVTTDKRLVFFNNTAGTGVNADVRAILDRGGIPYLSGMRTALAAVARLLDTPTAGRRKSKSPLHHHCPRRRRPASTHFARPAFRWWRPSRFAVRARRSRSRRGSAFPSS